MDQKDAKKQLRAAIRAAVGAMTPEQKAEESAEVCRRVLESPEWRNAGTVLLYESMKDEVDTKALVKAAESAGKKVLMPAQTWQEMLEAPLSEVGLAIIPGRAFTAAGFRMGRGGGYYDRILPSLHCQCWGLAFSVQMVDSIPIDSWDLPLSGIISA